MAGERGVGKALFAGLVFSEEGQPLGLAQVGEENYYVLDDHGFQRHIRARPVDEAVLRRMWEQMRGHEQEVADQTAKMLGQADLFTRGVLLHQLEHPEAYIEQVFNQGLPEETRLWFGMMGFRIVVDYHGAVVRIEQPAAPDSPD